MYRHLLKYRIHELMTRYLKDKAGSPPVDIHHMAHLCGVVSIEDREMIPEAVLSVEDSGFRIYLQCNFVHSRPMVLRRRFSIAHEIVHTFFYQMRGGCLKPMRQVPGGNMLEGACHEGAALLLVPDRFLSGELQGPDPIGGVRVVDLAGKFQVSIEVMLRRLDQLEVFESHRIAPVLARGFGREAEIEFAVYPTWLRLFLSKPRRGVGLSSWFLHRGTETEQKDATGPKSNEGMVGIGSSGLMRRTRHGVLWARRVWRGGAGCIYEIELQQDDSSHGVPTCDA